MFARILSPNYGRMVRPPDRRPPVDRMLKLHAGHRQCGWRTRDGRRPVPVARGIALAPDGSLYVADAGITIQHLSPAERFCRSGVPLQTYPRARSGRNVQRAVGVGCRTGWQRVCGRYLELPHPKVHPRWKFVQMWEPARPKGIPSSMARVPGG